MSRTTEQSLENINDTLKRIVNSQEQIGRTLARNSHPSSQKLKDRVLGEFPMQIDWEYPNISGHATLVNTQDSGLQIKLHIPEKDVDRVLTLFGEGFLEVLVLSNVKSRFV